MMNCNGSYSQLCGLFYHGAKLCTAAESSVASESQVLLKLESAYFEDAEKWDALLELLGYQPAGLTAL